MNSENENGKENKENKDKQFSTTLAYFERVNHLFILCS
jgi:hypothetical protein